MADVKSAVRALAASRGFTALAVSTLTVGLALATCIVTVVNAYVLRPLPYPAADLLYRVDYATPGQPYPRGMEALDWSQVNDVIDLSIAWDLDVFYLLGREYPEAAPGAWVTPGYIAGLGVRVAYGRTFTTVDYSPASPAVALISHRLWQSRFGGDTSIVGSTFNAYLSDRPEEAETFIIVGVLPPELWHVNVYTDVLTPLRSPSFPYQVRLRAGIPPSLASERIDRLVRGGLSNLPAHYQVRLTSLQDSYVAEMKPVLWSVLSGAALVLLIATSNVVVLMIVRAHKREREVAVRLALGASRTQVATMLALEGVGIAAVSTVLALVVAGLTLPGMAPFIEQSLERRVPSGLDALAIDAQVAWLVIACGAFVGAILALVPVLSLRRTRDALGIATAGRGLTAGAHSSHLRAWLIALEVAASLTLLVGAALMLESAVRMLRVDFGINAQNVMTASLALRQRAMPSDADRAQFYERLSAELYRVAGSDVVAFGDWWPLQGSRARRVEAGGDEPLVATANAFAVSPGYFDALGIRVDGRSFTPGDRVGAEPVVIVSASLAERLWPRRSPLGEPLTLHSDGQGQAVTHIVVGVVNDVRQTHDDADLMDVYLPLAQRASRFAFVYLREPRVSTWEADVRAAIARVHPEVALGTPRQLQADLEQERVRPQFLAYLLATFAIFASVLALVGMNGVIAYAVRQREREIAVRMALGADGRIVLAFFLRYAAVVLALGLVAGIAGAVGLGRVLQSQLFEVRAANVPTLVGTVILFTAFALPAAIWPAWLAATLDPAAVLKHE